MKKHLKFVEKQENLQENKQENFVIGINKKIRQPEKDNLV